MPIDPVLDDVDSHCRPVRSDHTGWAQRKRVTLRYQAAHM